MKFFRGLVREFLKHGIVAQRRRESMTRMSIAARIVSVVALTGIVWGCAEAPEPADLVLVGARVVTVDLEHPEAEALAIKGERILKVGTEEEILADISRFVPAPEKSCENCD
jgi:hypothetical protein